MVFKIVMLGPQGSGKGTQAEILAQKLNVSKIATGDIFRREMAAKSELGNKAQSFINQGKLVPDEVTNGMILKRLTEEDVQKGFVLDGFPRNLVQAKVLESEAEITHVLEIWISDEEAVHRLSGRRNCACGKVYHLEYNPPQEDERCDDCGQKLFIRDDDKPEAIEARLNIYHRETEPLVEFYKEKGILVKINGEQSIKEVNEEIIGKLGV